MNKLLKKDNNLKKDANYSEVFYYCIYLYILLIFFFLILDEGISKEALKNDSIKFVKVEKKNM